MEQYLCDMIAFSTKAYNAIVVETFRKDPVETGGVLIGHILDNGAWIVVDVLPPGPRTRHETAYFEWDHDFVNYIAPYTMSLYEVTPRVLGLWHRHPGSLDKFSCVDDGTNKEFAHFVGADLGAISGLVNIDPKFRLTMYHVSLPLRYQRINDIIVGDEFIPSQYLRLKHNTDRVDSPIYVYKASRNNSNSELSGVTLTHRWWNWVFNSGRKNSAQEHKVQNNEF